MKCTPLVAQVAEVVRIGQGREGATSVAPREEGAPGGGSLVAEAPAVGARGRGEAHPQQAAYRSSLEPAPFVPTSLVRS